MGMKESTARKGNAASKGHKETDVTSPNQEEFKRNHPQLGATGASQAPKMKPAPDEKGK